MPRTSTKHRPTLGPACCPTGLRATLERPDAERLAKLLKAVSDPARLQLLAVLQTGEEACVCDLQAAVGLSQPTVSYHLKLLAAAGLITREQRGTWAWYRISRPRMRELANVFDLADSAARDTPVYS